MRGSLSEAHSQKVTKTCQWQKEALKVTKEAQATIVKALKGDEQMATLNCRQQKRSAKEFDWMESDKESLKVLDQMKSDKESLVTKRSAKELNWMESDKELLVTKRSTKVFDQMKSDKESLVTKRSTKELDQLLAMKRSTKMLDQMTTRGKHMNYCKLQNPFHTPPSDEEEEANDAISPSEYEILTAFTEDEPISLKEVKRSPDGLNGNEWYKPNWTSSNKWGHGN
jgi:hypothetical protein